MKTYELINELKKVKGAVPYDGDHSVQVLLPTEDGRYLRVVSNDEGILSFDYYEGLNGEIVANKK